MRILYGIQGTGNGHLARAKAILPELRKFAEVDLLISGEQSELSLDQAVKYRLKGVSLIFGKKGGIDYQKSLQKAKLGKFIKDTKKIPVLDYDLVLSDFEPVSAWAARGKAVPLVQMSNQSSLLSPHFPKPKNIDFLTSLVLKYFAPGDYYLPISYQAYADNFYTPPIRKEVRVLQVYEGKHYLVYLPAYSDKKVAELLNEIADERFQVFTKKSKFAYKQGNCEFQPIQDECFLKSLASCAGVITAAGFSTSSEALFLGKKLLVIPMKKQFEQLANAQALKQMGVSILKSFKKKRITEIQEWMFLAQGIQVDFPESEVAIAKAIQEIGLKHRDNFLDQITTEQYLS